MREQAKNVRTYRSTYEKSTHLHKAPESTDLVIGLLWVIAFISFFVPEEYAIGHTMRRVWQIAACVVSATVLLFYLWKCSPSVQWVLLMSTLLVYYIISTLINHSDGSIINAFFNIVRVGGFATLLEYGLRQSENTALKALLLAGVLMCAAHYVTYIQWRDVPLGMRGDVGYMYESWNGNGDRWFLLKHDNGSAFYFLPIMSGLWYYSCIKKKGLALSIVFSILTIYMYWDLWSVTAMIICTVSAVLYAFIYFSTDKSPLFNLSYRTALFGGILICILVIFTSTGDLGIWLSRVFNKGSGIGRSYVWERAIEEILKKPLFGAGFEMDFTTAMKLRINHCHNVVLQVLYTGGALCGSLFLAWATKCGDTKDYPSESTRYRRGITVLRISIFATILLSTLDWYFYLPITIMPFILHSQGSSLVYDKD